MKTTRYLLDTHVFLWWMNGSSRLRGRVAQEISTADLVYVSAASAWEAAIKIALGKLRIPESFTAGVEKAGFEKLPILFSHAEESANLPPHHSDPFDRMLVAQARIEGLTLITHDRFLRRYEIDILLA